MPGTATKRRANAPRKMPVRTRWVDLTALPEERLKIYEDVGEEPPDYTGWKVKSRMGLRMGLYNKTMRAMQEMQEVEDRNKDGDYTPTAADAGILANSFEAMLDFCRGHVVEWNFVDEEGEDIPYSDEAWDLLDSDLVVCSFGAVQGAATKTPKGN